MINKTLLTGFILCLSPMIKAASSFYCPQNHSYINTGMTQDQVIQSCGQPTERREGGGTVSQQVPVTQLVYSTLNQGAVDFYPGLNPIYQMWSLPSGSQGINVQVNLVNDRVSDITVNQAHTNGLSACQGGSFQIGDSLSAVISACGSPDMINHTYINQPVSKNQNPQTWIYSFPYQPSVKLTFVNGILQSIY